MNSFRLAGLLVLVGSLGNSPLTRAADAGPNPFITPYPSAYFATAQPATAFDMLAVLPGYVFSDSDSDVRGLSGAIGNVMIDGSRPTNKQESLEVLLRRIPAAAVERVELIRAGAPGIEMQGQPALANVVRRREVQTRGVLEIESAFYERGFDAPRLAGELSRRGATDLIELSAAAYETVDDEHGIGTRPRIAPDGSALRRSAYKQDEGERVRELGGLYERSLTDGLLRVTAALKAEKTGADISERITFPSPSDSSVREFGDEDSAEFGVHFEHRLEGGRQLELIGIHRTTGERGGEIEAEDDESTLFEERVDGSESIVRGSLRWMLGEISIESGIEGALNVLDSRNSLEVDGAVTPLPGGNTRVEEQRGEAFTSASWPVGTAWRIEAGSRFELSRLSLSGDSDLDKSFFFAKPRILATWSMSAKDRMRFLLERDVSQLDFEDFAGSASLSSSTVTAGNPDLVPERTWRVEAAWERAVLGSGALLLAVRHEHIDDLIDRIPIIADEPFDAVGNIGRGRRTELQLDLTLPLDRIGLRSGLLRTSALWRDSSAIDPTTGDSRPISEDLPREIEIHFSQQIARARLRWGIDLTLASSAQDHYFDEIRTERLGTRLDVFAQFEATPAWHVEFFARNLADRSAVRERRIYDGLRSVAPFDYTETRTLKIGPYFGVTARRSFGS